MKYFILFIFVAFFKSNDAARLTRSEAAACLKAHNMLRRLHVDTPDLVWDDGLAAKAQAYAEQLVRDNIGLKKVELNHSDDDGIGENLFWSYHSGGGATCAQASLSWYKEINDYDYKTALSKNGKAVDHFTQLVWRDSTVFGLGIATVKSRRYGRYARYGNIIETYIVAKYFPQGNFHIINQRLQVYSRNVLPRKPGARTPTLAELQSGSGSSSGSGSGVQNKCRNKVNAIGDFSCKQFLVSPGNYRCDGDNKDYFQRYCYKQCYC